MLSLLEVKSIFKVYMIKGWQWLLYKSENDVLLQETTQQKQLEIMHNLLIFFTSFSEFGLKIFVSLPTSGSCYKWRAQSKKCCVSSRFCKKNIRRKKLRNFLRQDIIQCVHSLNWTHCFKCQMHYFVPNSLLSSSAHFLRVQALISTTVYAQLLWLYILFGARKLAEKLLVKCVGEIDYRQIRPSGRQKLFLVVYYVLSLTSLTFVKLDLCYVFFSSTFSLRPCETGKFSLVCYRNDYGN
jgi:hypothetical protein